MKRRKDGYYQQSITLPAAGGGTKRKVFYGKTQAAVREKVTAARLAAAEGILGGKSTVSDYCKAWLEAKMKSKELNTVSQYDYELAHVTKVIGDMKMSDVTRADVQAIINRHTHKPRTTQAIKRTFNQVCDVAIGDGVLRRNPCKNLTLPDYIPKEKDVDIDTDEILRLEWPDEQELLLAVLICLGVRRQEALALTWQDIDFETKKVHIRRAVVYDGNTPIIKRPKSKKSERTLPFPKKYFYILEKHRKTGYLINRSGKVLTKSAFRRLWEKIEDRLEEEGFGKVTPHMFRHAYCSRLYETGVDVKKAQQYMGHASISTTLGIYTHLSQVNKDDSSDIDEAFALSLKERKEKEDLERRMKELMAKVKQEQEIEDIKSFLEKILPSSN